MVRYLLDLTSTVDFIFFVQRNIVSFYSFSFLISNYRLSQVDFKFSLRLRHLSGIKVCVFFSFNILRFLGASLVRHIIHIFLFTDQFLSLGCILHTELYARAHAIFHCGDDIRSTAWFAKLEEKCAGIIHFPRCPDSFGMAWLRAAFFSPLSAQRWQITCTVSRIIFQTDPFLTYDKFFTRHQCTRCFTPDKGINAKIIRMYRCSAQSRLSAIQLQSLWEFSWVRAICFWLLSCNVLTHFQHKP